MTVTQYAKLKGVTRQTVLSKIKRGILKAKRVDMPTGKFIWIIEDPD